jgi:hypothetical protein
MITVLFSVLFFTVGVMAGFIAQEKWTAYLLKNEHEFEQLFKENPHPEIYDQEGKIHRGTYLGINFDPDFDPDDSDNWEITRD